MINLEGIRSANSNFVIPPLTSHLSHLIHQVSPEELLAIIRTDLDDFERFVREVDAWLGRFS